MFWKCKEKNQSEVRSVSALAGAALALAGLLLLLAAQAGARAPDLQKVVGPNECAECHKQDLVIDNDRRVADVETVYDPTNGIFNNLFATAVPLFTAVPDGSGHPDQKVPTGGSNSQNSPDWLTLFVSSASAIASPESAKA